MPLAWSTGARHDPRACITLVALLAAATGTVAPAAAQDAPDGADAVRRPVSLPRFHSRTADTARAFLDVFGSYTRRLEADLRQALARRGAAAAYDSLSRLTKDLRTAHSRTYRRAMRLATAHVHDFRDALAVDVDPASTYLQVHKSAFVVCLMEPQGRLALAAFPMAFGVHPDAGPKERLGDLRTPESAAGERSPATTPFHAHPLVAGDPYPDAGCIGRGIGVSSSDPVYDYLAGGWQVMLHGTPDRGCMGTRASHGCIRLLPEHIEVLFEHVTAGTRIVILP